MTDAMTTDVYRRIFVFLLIFFDLHTSTTILFIYLVDRLIDIRHDHMPGCLACRTLLVYP